MIKVLIVDDSAVIRQRLADLLSGSNGVRVVGQASGPAEALASLPILKPNVVTLDVRMPGGSGIDVIRPIKEASAGVTIIMLTNYPCPRYERECRERGADFFLDKSRDFGRILEILNGLRDAHERKEART